MAAGGRGWTGSHAGIDTGGTVEVPRWQGVGGCCRLLGIMGMRLGMWLCGWRAGVSRVLAAGLFFGWIGSGCGGHAGQAQEPATAAPDAGATLAYIHKSWDELSRSMTDCHSLVDVKVTSNPVLY